MAKKHSKTTAPRKIESTPKKGSPIKAGKQPVGINLTPPPQPAKPITGRKANGGAKAAAPVAFTPAVSYDQIASRAYLIWEYKGCPDGRDEENWREAEEQLRHEALSV